jgi:HEAT repeat protein
MFIEVLGTEFDGVSESEVALLTSATQDETATIRVGAAYILGELSAKSPAVDSALLQLALHDEDEHVRVQALDGLSHLGSEAITEALFKVISDPEFDVGLVDLIAQSFARLEPRASVEQRLLGALQHGDENARVSAAYALGYMESDAALNPLIAAAGDDAAAVRAAVLEAFYTMRRDGTEPTLLTALRDPAAAVRERAIHCIARLDWEPGLDAILIAARHDDASGVRCAAISALLHFHDARVQTVFIEALSDEDAAVRIAAAYSLGSLGSEAAVAPLLAALSDEDRAVREAAMGALGALGAAAAVPRLLDLVEDSPAARRALWEIAERQVLLNK